MPVLWKFSFLPTISSLTVVQERYLSEAAVRWEREFFANGPCGRVPRSCDPKFVSAVVATLMDQELTHENLQYAGLLHESGAFRREVQKDGRPIYVPITPTVERALWHMCSLADDELSKATARYVVWVFVFLFFALLLC